MSRYHFELATRADDDALREILAAAPMPGVISIAFHREPSFFDAAAVEGHFQQVIAAREKAAGRIVGFGSRCISSRHVNGQPTPIGYLGYLRLLESHRKSGLVARGYSYFRQLHEDGRTHLYLTTIAQDNETAKAILTSGRAGLPRYHPAGRFQTAALPLLPGRGLGRRDARVAVRLARAEDLGTIAGFLREVGPRQQFFPCYELSDFSGPTGLLRGLRPQDVLLAFRNGRLRGILGAWDQSAFRQDIIHGYSWPLRWLRPMYNGWARLRGRPRLPKPGSMLRCLMGALPVVVDDDPDVFSSLLDTLICEKSGRGWDYLLVGVHESQPLLKVLSMYPARWYTTCLYLVCWDDGEALRCSLDGRPIYLELGSL